jgi:hypothetical protein
MEVIRSIFLFIIIFGIMMIGATCAEIWKEEERRAKMERMVDLIGKPAAYEMLAEECSELAHAALKMARILRGENPTPKTEEEMEQKLLEEATDVELCLMDVGIEPDADLMAAKMKRFRKRMKGEMK